MQGVTVLCHLTKHSEGSCKDKIVSFQWPETFGFLILPYLVGVSLHLQIGSHDQVVLRKRPHEVLAFGGQIPWANPHLFSASLH